MGIIIEKFDKIALKFAKEKIKENPKYMEECMIHINDAGLYAMLLTSGGSYDIDGGEAFSCRGQRERGRR